MHRSRIHVLGASGSGTTTLARALADRWSVPHADADDYFWLPTDPPYRQARPAEQRAALMEQVFAPREAWVVSGSMIGWGDGVLARCEAIVFLTLDPEVRMARLGVREQVRRAEAGQGGTDAELDVFLDWARGYDDPAFEGRSRRTHEAWLSHQPAPVLRLDSATPVADLVESVLAWEPSTSPRPTEARS